MTNDRPADLSQVLGNVPQIQTLVSLHRSVVTAYERMDQLVAMQIDRLRKRQLRSRRVIQIGKELEVTLAKISDAGDFLPAEINAHLDDIRSRLSSVLGRDRS